MTTSISEAVKNKIALTVAVSVNPKNGMGGGMGGWRMDSISMNSI
jgi:hypothetical protein